MFTVQMDAPAGQSVLGTYDFVAVGIYYFLVLAVSVYVSLHFAWFTRILVSVEAICTKDK
jgi:hypothetical protein